MAEMRLQSAVEFLATYSWAFLILAIFLAAAYVIVASPSAGPVPYATLPSKGVVEFNSWLASNPIVTNFHQQYANSYVTFNQDPPACLQAAFNSIKYSLTMAANPGAGGTTSPAIGGYLETSGSIVSISETPASSLYIFNGWIGSGAGSYSGPLPSTSVTVTGSITETANYIPLQVVSIYSSPTAGAPPPAAEAI